VSKKNLQKNVLGEELEECSKNPLTGWFRDGCCNTDENDHGLHTVCVKVNDQFLNSIYHLLQEIVEAFVPYQFLRVSLLK